MSISAGTRLGRYEIRSKLGEGGMGEVYLAEDTTLHRRVAIKFLPVDSADNEQARQRLLREAQAAAKLDHPNICSVNEIGEESGRSFIVMQYVEGETLDARLKRKPLDVSESLSIATHVADALAHAHAHGIIHRDIKPSNIMITARGQAKVMDFGLARFSEPHGIAGGPSIDTEASTQALLTTPGTIIGTVPYMSPEQVHGQRVDARTDIFSFGVVLYEMLTGQQPFAAESGAATISAILTRDPSPLADFISNGSEELQRIVRKSIEKNRERRYQTMRDVAIDLDNCKREFQLTPASTPQPSVKSARTFETTRPKLLLTRRTFVTSAIVLCLLAAVTLIYSLVARRNATVRAPEIKSLAVLPLNNLSGDPSQEYFADGMTEALINNLSQIRALRVISRQSVMRYKESRESLPEIARQLGDVDAVIQGSVQRAGGRVRVTVQLIPATTDAPIWSRSYEQELSDLLKLESDVAQAIAREVRAQLTSAEQSRLTSAKPIDPKAQEAYLLGQYHLARLDESDLSQAIDYFQRAIQIEPNFAGAYAGLSRAWSERGVWGHRTYAEVEAPARDAALKSLQIDPGNSSAHTSMCMILINYDHNWSAAEEEVKRAIEIDPGSADAYVAYGWLLQVLGRHDEVRQKMQIAEQLDPVSSRTEGDFGRMLYRARKYDEAEMHLKRSIELDSNNYGSYGRLGDVYIEMGRYADAIAMFEKSRSLQPSGAQALRLAVVYARMGKRKEALEALASTPNRSAWDLARLYTELRDPDKVFSILNEAIDKRDALLTNLKEDPSFDSLHSDPRWKQVMARLNFAV